MVKAHLTYLPSSPNAGLPNGDNDLPPTYKVKTDLAPSTTV